MSAATRSAEGRVLSPQPVIQTPPNPPTVQRNAGNPDVTTYGPGPEGAVCGLCAHLSNLHALRRAQDDRWATGTIYFCQLDRQEKRVTWPACSRFLEAQLNLKPD
jgi:hypothetical protein